MMKLANELTSQKDIGRVIATELVDSVSSFLFFMSRMREDEQTNKFLALQIDHAILSKKM